MTAVAQAARHAFPLVGASALAVVVGAELVREPSMIRLATAACIGVCAVVAATQAPERAVLGTLLLLPFLALARRLLLEFTGWQSTDPLLLLAPAVLGLILVRLFVLERRELMWEPISKLVVVVMLLTLLQVANPRGSGLTAGVAALLFAAVPLAWYFVGRELVTPRAMRALYGGLVVVGCLVAVYGLNQTWNGLPSWDLEWVRQSGYAALSVGEVTRAFGTFSSAAEYAAYLGIATVVAVAFALRGMPHLLPAVPLLVVAMFYESGRGIIVATVFAVVVVIAARTGSVHGTVLALVACLAAIVLAFTFGRGFLQEQAASSSDPLVAHQLGGLSDPLNQDTSTLPTHLAMFENGVRRGVLDPIGHGITSTTLAGETLGNGEANTTTEVDISNAFVSLGTLGGLTYLALVLLVLWSALQLAVRRRDAVSLAALGTLVLVLGQWLNGGYYAVSPLVWVTAGFVVAYEGRR